MKKQRTDQDRENDRFRRKARKLAKRLDCEIQLPDWRSGESSYWVYGPADVYELAWGREDPFEGEHCCASWAEVVEHLKAYEVDLAFCHIHIDERNTDIVLEHVDPKIVAKWVETGDPVGLAVMADWLEEHHPDEVATIGALRSRYEAMFAKRKA
jgi:sugar phosphate isomerase/epimerase